MNATGSTSNATNILLSLGIATDSGLSGLGGEAEGNDFSSMLSQLLSGRSGKQEAMLLPDAAGIQTLPPEQQILPQVMASVAPDETADVTELLGQISTGLEMFTLTGNGSVVQPGADPDSVTLMAAADKMVATSARSSNDSNLPGDDVSVSQEADGSAILMLASVSEPPQQAAAPFAAGALKSMSHSSRQEKAVASMTNATSEKAGLLATARASSLPDSNSPGAPVLNAEEADFLLPGEEPPVLVRNITLQGQQNMILQHPAGTNSISMSATFPPAAENPVDIGSDASSFSAELSSETLTDSGQQSQRLQLSKDKLEFGQDRREWGGALGARIMTMVAEDVQKARIQLDPPELGNLEIKLQISQDQATVQVQAQHAHVRDVLEANAQRLRDALAAQGISLAGFDVSERGQGSADSGPSGNGQRSSTADDEWLAEDLTTDDHSQPRMNSNNLLDTFV